MKNVRNNVSGTVLLKVRLMLQTISLCLLAISLERKPEQSEALTVVTEKAPNPAANSGEYVAHEVKLVAPNTNVNSGLQGLQEGATTTSPSGLSTGAIQGDISGTSSTLVNSPNGPREPKPRQNYGVAPSFLLVPKRRVFHNVRSSLKANVPGRLPLFLICEFLAV